MPDSKAFLPLNIKSCLRRNNGLLLISIKSQFEYYFKIGFCFSVYSSMVEFFVITQKFNTVKLERRIYKYRYLFNTWCLLTEFKQCVDPLADILIKGHHHLFSLLYCTCFSLRSHFSFHDFAHLQKGAAWTMCVGTLWACYPRARMGKEGWQKLAA